MGYNGIRTIIKPRRFSSFRKFFEEKKKGGLLRARGERERGIGIDWSVCEEHTSEYTKKGKRREQAGGTQRANIGAEIT